MHPRICQFVGVQPVGGGSGQATLTTRSGVIGGVAMSKSNWLPGRPPSNGEMRCSKCIRLGQKETMPRSKQALAGRLPENRRRCVKLGRVG